MKYNLSPLTSWYFCACLKVPPKEASVFLSILETLQNPESGAQLLYGAYKELAKLDAWQQVFILPTALDSLRREDLPAGFAQSFTSYLYELKEFLQDINLPSNGGDANSVDEVANPLASLLDAFVEHSDRGIRDNLKSAISQVACQPPPQVTSSQLAIPYLALMEYLPQTLLITSLLHLISDEQFSAIAENEWKENTLLSDFIFDALNYRFGRQAFVLAIYFQLKLAQRKLLPLRELPGIDVMKNASPCFVLEPDLVQAYSAYRSCLFALESNAPSEALLDEYLSLYHFRQILLEQEWFPISGDPQHKANLSALVERAGGQNRKDWLLLAVTYWQAAQVNVLFSLNIDRFIQLLPKFWVPAEKVPEEVILRNLPPLSSNKREISVEASLVNTIFRLLAAERSSNDTNIHPEYSLSRKIHREKFASQFLEEKKTAWLFFSPWLSFRNDKKVPYYIEPGSLANFLRLANGFFIAQKVLQLGFRVAIPAETQRLLASLVLHVSDVLSLFSGHLDNLKFGNKSASKLLLALPLQISSLALWMRRQTELIAQGFYTSLPVEVFGNLLDKPAHNSRDGVLFFRHILPKTLLTWVNMAYSLACAGRAALHWFEGEDSVVRKIFEQKRNDWEAAPYALEIEILNLQLVFRFLIRHDGDPTQHFARFDWRNGKFDARKNKLIPSPPASCWAQQFLLTGPAEQVFWASKDWEKSKLKDLRLVVCSIERWFSSTVYEVEDELAIQWHEAFKDILRTFGSPRDLHRFVRLRLVEILEVFVTKPLAMELSDATSIVRLILEFGSPYDLHRLLEVLFPHEQGALKPVRKEDDMKRLRTTALDSLNQFLDTNHLDAANNQVRLPEQQAWHWLRVEVVESLFQRLAFSYWKSKEHPLTASNEFYQNLTEIAKAKCQDEQARANLTERVRTFELSYFQRNSQAFSKVGDFETVQPFMVERAVVNPNSGQVKVLFDPIYKAVRSVVQYNFFEKSFHELQAFGKDGEIILEAVLAYCIEVDKYGVRFFNCGLKFFLSQEQQLDNRYEEIKPGNWALLTLRVNNRSWSVQNAKPFNFNVQANVQDKLLPNLSAKNSGKNAIPLKSAFPDIAKYYSFSDTQRVALEKEKFWTLFNSRTGTREPYPFGFTELLLWSENFGGQAVLAFVREDPTSSSLVFSTSPGVHFYLRPTQFFEPFEEDSSALSLNSFLNSAKDLSGELLTVRPVFWQGLVLLEIVATIQHNEKLEKQYPNLSQFDTRNYDWAHIFDAEGGEQLGYDYFTAYKKEWTERGLRKSCWFIKLDEPVPGFPDEIEIENDLRTNQAQAVVSIENWDTLNQLKGKVIVRLEEEEQRNVPLPMLNELCKLQIGSLLKAENILHLLDRPKADAYGRVRCITKFGVLMHLETESISLLPLKMDTPLDKKMLQNRQLVVSYIHHMKELRMLPTLIFDKNYLPDALQSANRLEGFLTKTAGANYFAVNWRLPNGEFSPPEGLRLANPEVLANLKSPIQPGLFLDAIVREGKVEARLQQKIINLRATWKLKDVDSIPPGYFFVGADEGPKDWYFENEDSHGFLLRLPRYPGRQANKPVFLSNTSTAQDFEGFASEWRIPPGLETTTDQRVPVTQGVNVMMARRNDEPSPRRKRLMHVRIKPYFQTDGSCDFKRFFEFALEEAPVQQVTKHQSFKSQAAISPEPQTTSPAPALQAEPKVNKQEKLAQEALERYRSNPFPLNGVFDEKTWSLNLTDINLPMVPVSISPIGHINWGKKVSVQKNEGAYLSSNQYPKTAEFILFEEEEGNVLSLKGSLRRHDYSPETFREKFFPNAQIGDLVELEHQLVVVGEEKKHPILEDVTYAEPHFRFEWGYGLTMTLPIRHLTVDGKPIAELKECVLAMMDRVKAISFVERGKNEDDGLQLGIEIRSFEIIYSSGSQIYRQRKHFKFVHLLTLVEHKGSLVVDTISGGNHFANKPSYDFHVNHASLRNPAPLLERLSKSKSKEDGQEQFLFVYGRLDEKNFRDSFGSKVIFDHVWLSFADESSCGALPLEKSGEILFFKSGEVFSIAGGNDYVLELSPLDGIPSEDVGTDFKTSKLGVRKRQFSAREDTLSKVFKYRQRKDSNNSDYFPIGSWVISRVELIGERLIFINMTSRMPQRLPNILGDLIRKGEDVLVTVLQIEEQDLSFTVELRPGIFIKLNRENKRNVRRCPEILAQGDRLKVSLADDKNGEMVFDLDFAAFSEFDYVSNKPRLAVILPKNNLLRQEDVNNPRILKQLADKDFFTIGGLPNVEPLIFKMPGRNAEDDLKVIMACRHPKFVELWKEDYKSRQVFFILPVPNAPLVGKIKVKDEQPFFVSMDDREKLPLQWEFLSFQACTAEALTEQFKDSVWEYHDKRTGFWHLPNGSPVIVEPDKISKHNGEKGPLVFLENRLGALHLRPYKENWLNFGFPIDEIFIALRGSKKVRPMTFIGLAAPNRIWVEISPGRLAEMTPQVIEFNYGNGQFPLADFNWQNCSEGDSLFFNLASDSPLEIERLHLRNYVSANRAIIGNQRCLAPFTCEPGGALKIGKGAFAITVPFCPSDEVDNASFCSIDQQNNLRFATDKLLEKGQLLELTISANGSVEIPGRPGWSAVPDAFDDSWERFLRQKGLEHLRLFKYQGQKRIPHPEVFWEVVSEFNPLIVKISYVGNKVIFVKPALGETPYFSSPGKFPLNGDTVFIAENEQGELHVLGFEYRKVYAEPSKIAWMDDPINFLLTEVSNNGNVLLRKRPLMQVIKLCGGALPVTMEGYDVKMNGNHFYFSRRNQINTDFLHIGQKSIATYLGMLNEDFALLRCGTELLSMHIEKIIEDIQWFDVWRDLELRSQIFNILEKEAQIWIRKEEKGDVLPGFRRDTLGIALQADLLGIVSKNNQVEGCVMRTVKTQKIYWLPAGRMSWMDSLDEDIFRKAFPGGPVKACLLRENGRLLLSLVDLKEVLHEFNSLKPGNELAVRMIERLPVQPGAPARFVAQTLTSNILISGIADPQRFREFDEEQKSSLSTLGNDLFRMTVLRKIQGPPHCIEVAWGTAPLQLDLPVKQWKPRDGGKSTYPLSIFKKYRNKSAAEIQLEIQEKLGIKTSFLDQDLSEVGEDLLREYLFLLYRARFDINPLRADLRKAAVRVADFWLEKNLDAETLELSCALTSVLILEKELAAPDSIVRENDYHRDLQFIIIKALHEISLRSIRSAHVEALGNFLNNEDYAESPFHLSANLDFRWEEVRKICLGYANDATNNGHYIPADRLDFLQQFCQAARLYKEFDDLVEIILNVIGDSKAFLTIDEARIVRRLAKIQKKLPGYHADRKDMKIPDFWWWEQTDCFDELKKCLSELVKKDIVLLNHFWR